jgi:hypothetical protein
MAFENLDQLKPGISQEDLSAAVKEINQVLAGNAPPPVPPLTPVEDATVRSALLKNAGAITPEEQSLILRGLAQWDREGRK